MFAAGEAEGALARAVGRRALGREPGIVDLGMFALATEGMVRIAQGAVPDGMRRLDEAAAAALGGEFDDLRAAGCGRAAC